MAGINFIRRWVMGQMKKTSDDGIMITLPDSNKVDLNVSITMDRLIRNGIDPNQIKSSQQVDNAVNMINSRMVNRSIPADSAEGREITEKIFGKQKAPVFDLQGNRIPEDSGIMGGKSLKNLMESGQVTKGARGMDKSKKVQDREMFQAANQRLTSDVDTIIKNIKRLSPMDAMKEANLVIGRKGYYKNLSPEESKKILKDTEDHIFERDIPEEDFATGGRAGLRFGGDTMGGKNDKSKSSPGPDRSKVSDRQQANHDRAMSDRSNDGPKGPPSIINSPPKNNKPPETITFDNVTGKKMTAADRLAKQKFIDFIHSKKVYSSGENEEADDLYDAYRTASGLDNFQTNALVSSTANQLVNDIDGNTKTFYDRNATIRDLDTGKSTKQLTVETPTSFTRRVVRPSGIMENDIPQPFGAPQSLSIDPMKMTELSQKQLDFLNQPINQKSLKDSSFGLTPKEIFDKLPSYEEKPFFGTNQEPTTPEEYNQYLDSIGVPRMTAANGGVAGLLGERPRYQTGGDVAYDASDASIFGSNAITVTPETVSDAFGNQVQQEMGNTYNPPLIQKVQEEKAVVEDTKKEEVIQNTDDAPFLKDADGNPLLSSKPILSPMPVLGNAELTADPISSIGFPKKPADQRTNDLQGEPLVKQVQMSMMTREKKPDFFHEYAQDVIDTNGYPSKTFAQYRKEAGLTNRGILPINQLPGFSDDTNSKLDVPQGGMNFTEKSPNMSDEDIMKGFQEYQKQNPYSGPSTQAVVNLTLPGGTPMSFNSGAGASALRKYLESIGMEAGRPDNSLGGGLSSIQLGEYRGGELGTNLTNQSPLMKAAMANGGRAGFAGGGMGRRGFLKLLAGAGAGIAGLKSGLVNILGKGTGKEVAKEVVKQSTSTPPPYFFKLAEKIKNLGDDIGATTDRTVAKSLKSKDGKVDYILEEDMVSGDTLIKKVNKEGDEMITDIEIMELRKGEVVRGPDGKPVKTPDSYEEVTETNARIEGDVFNDPYYTDGIKIDDIMKEVGEQAPSIKKASGGIARMLGE